LNGCTFAHVNVTKEYPMNTSPLVTVEWLQANLHNPLVRIVDTRWYLMEPARGRTEYLEGHIPGAVYLSVDTDLSAPKGSGPGRHPLPSAEAFATTAGDAGISNDTLVVIYDLAQGAAGTRLWWLLRYFGHSQIVLLDGGWQAWQAAELPIEAGAATVAPAAFVATPHPEMVVNASDVEQLRHAPNTLMLDARARERYEGLVEPIDSQAGHIPGAKSAPFSENITADGNMHQAQELRTRFAALGAEQAQTLVCYCGSGVSATQNLLALEIAGFSGGLLYEGSWSDWSSDPTRPVATDGE
jgi:thiosulfate/3-mercaptopyruvate sulfurtransferase